MIVAASLAALKDIAKPMLAASAALAASVEGVLTTQTQALQLWLEKRAAELDFIVVPFDQIFEAVRAGQAEVGLIIHEGQLTYQDQGLELCEDLGRWWKEQNDGLPLPLGGNVIHKRLDVRARQVVSDILTASIRFSKTGSTCSSPP